MKIAPTVLALLIGAATAVTAVQAQQSTSPGVTQPPASTTRTDKGPARDAHGSWSAKDFMNSAVYNTAGDRIGDIRDVIVDDGGRVASIVIGVGGFLGMGEKDVSLTPDKLKRMVYNDGKTYFTANATKQELEAAPKYTAPRT